MSNAARISLMVLLAIIFYAIVIVPVYYLGSIPLIGEFTRTEEEWSMELGNLGMVLPVALAYLIMGRRGFRWMYGWVAGSLFSNDE